MRSPVMHRRGMSPLAGHRIVSPQTGRRALSPMSPRTEASSTPERKSNSLPRIVFNRVNMDSNYEGHTNTSKDFCPSFKLFNQQIPRCNNNDMYMDAWMDAGFLRFDHGRIIITFEYYIW